MMTLGKRVLTFVGMLAAYAVLLQGFRLMNLPSDRSLYSGLALVLLIMLIVPAALWAIWRRRT